MAERKSVSRNKLIIRFDIPQMFIDNDLTYAKIRDHIEDKTGWYASPKVIKKLVRQFSQEIRDIRNGVKTTPSSVPSSDVDIEDLQKQISKFVNDEVSTHVSAYMDDKVDEQIKRAVGEGIKSIPVTEFKINDMATKKVKKFKKTLPRNFKKILALASARVNIMLVGPAGCGKTHLSGLLAEVLSLEFYSISCSLGMSESQLAGWLVPTGAGGKFEYRRSNFIRAYEEGGVFLMDEIDASDPNTLTFINSAIANDSFSVPNRPNKRAKRHKDFVFIACANTFGNGANRMYVGRNQMDMATLDRFSCGTIEMDYDPDVEAVLISKDVLVWGRKFRQKVTETQLRRVVSTRFLRDLSIMAKASKEFFGDEEQWFNTATSGWTQDEIRKVA